MPKVCLLTKAQFDGWRSNGNFPRCTGHEHLEHDKADKDAARRVGNGWRRAYDPKHEVLVQVADEPDPVTFEEALAPFVFEWNRVSGGPTDKGLREGLRKGREAW